MKPKEFFDAVVRMREKQREYFKTKTSSALARDLNGSLMTKKEFKELFTKNRTRSYGKIKH